MDKVQTLKRYKFSLAFENSNEEDYVTEKFFQSLVAGISFFCVGFMILYQFQSCNMLLRVVDFLALSSKWPWRC